MKIFQTSSLFETNKFHHGGPPFSGGPGAIAPVAPPLIRPWGQGLVFVEDKLATLPTGSVWLAVCCR